MKNRQTSIDICAVDPPEDHSDGTGQQQNPNDHVCTRPRDHEGQHACEPCSDHRGAPGWSA